MRSGRAHRRSAWLLALASAVATLCSDTSWAPRATAQTAASPAGGTTRAPEPDTAFLVQYTATLGFRLGQPSSVNVTPDGAAVLFLRSGPRSFVHDLWEFDVAKRRERVLLTAEQVLRGANERLPHAERARRERQRVATRGIVAYSLSEDG